MGSVKGALSKMRSRLDAPVQYALPVGEQEISLNDLVGKKIQLEYLGEIYCQYCDRKTNKSFNQGFCYPCFKKLARCDSCIVSPEKCHFDQGTCREPEWAASHCNIEHIVYLSNTSGPKVGITRASQVPTRWIDQGAIQALPVLAVATRHLSGILEHALKDYVADKTNWRAMLKGETEKMDLAALRDTLLQEITGAMNEQRSLLGSDAVIELEDEPVDIEYPVETYPTKVTSFNFDKQPVVEGVLNGIKGQYLILDTGVINIRKFTSYQVAVQA
jgi:hypothetical protein